MIVCDFCGKPLKDRNIQRVCTNESYIHPYIDADVCFDCQLELHRRQDNAVAEYYKECKCKNEHK
jgi:hypothetical protein